MFYTLILVGFFMYIIIFIYLAWQALARSIFFFFSKRHTGLKSVPQNMQWEVFCVI